jgi:alpha-L-fucosidase
MALEVFNACRAEGLAVGAYFSKPDWSSSNFWWSYYPPKDRNPSYDTTKYPERWRAFVKYTQGQLDELVSGYGPLDILWLDGCWVRPLSTINEGVAEFCKYPHDLDIDMKSIAANARRRQPGILIVDRWVQGEFENYLTPEQKIPAQPLSAPWESCITLGGAWGWVPHDQFKSSREVIQMLVRIVAKGGNLLLGIGPDGRGEFDPVIYERLAEIGKWLQVNGEAIYGSHPVAPFQDGKVAYTAQGGESIYAIYLPEKNETQWPEEVSIKTDLPGPYDVGVPALREKVSYRLGDGGVIAEIPASLRNRAAQEPALVIRLRHAASAPDH